MSALGSAAGGKFEQVLLRSSTPGPNEKVLKYLQGLEISDADNRPPASLMEEYEDYQGDVMKSPGSRRSRKSRSRLGDDAAKSEASVPRSRATGAGRVQTIQEDEGDEIKSTTQEGQNSIFGDEPQHEPGPNDLPGPRYQSYDSSFGNFGPLPADDPPPTNALFGSTWNPTWTAQPPPQTDPAGLPLPESVASPRATSVAINVETPSSPRSKSKAPSKVSKSRSVAESDNKTPTPASPRARTMSRATSEKPATEQGAPMSPRSRMSTKNGTVYPPLPESTAEGLASPRARSMAYSKAPSVSPSDSPSQPRKVKASTKGQSVRSPTASVFSGNHQDRPFSPYRHAATAEDLLHAAVRGRAFVPPETIHSEKEPTEKEPTELSSRTPTSPKQSKVRSVVSDAAPSTVKPASVKAPSVAASSRSKRGNGEATPQGTPRPPSPNELNAEEEDIVKATLRRSMQTPRTSMYEPSTLGTEVVNSHFHDMDLCVLLHQESDPNVHDIVKKALRKAIRQRVKKLGMKADNESIKQYRKSFHNHDPSVHLQANYTPSVADDTPEWAKELIQNMVLMQKRIESLGPKIEELKSPLAQHHLGDGSRFHAMENAEFEEGDQYSQSEMTQTINIHTHPTGTMADSMYLPETDLADQTHDHDEMLEEEEYDEEHRPATEGGTYTQQAQSEDRDDSPGQQYLEEQLFKLQQRPSTGRSQSGQSHRTWEVAGVADSVIEEPFDDEMEEHAAGASGLPTIPDTNAGGYTGARGTSPPLPALPSEANRDSYAPPPWQRIHQRLLNWAIVWPMSELDGAMNSTTRGKQVDEVALSIWTTQTYKRYVRAKLTDSPQGTVDRLFVPPNMADAISSAVFHGRHGDACGMLRDLWSPFGLEGTPRLLIVLAKHRNDPDHWLVHRFSIPDGALTTYDSYPDRSLHDGRPLGWWFAIRIAWPHGTYPSPDHLLQKMVRLHRPMQLPIDNSVAAAGIWRNILMGSRAERSLDLERLRDLINTEVKNLRQRKQMGKLSVGSSRGN